MSVSTEEVRVLEPKSTNAPAGDGLQRTLKTGKTNLSAAYSRPAVEANG